MKALTARQAAILAFIAKRVRANGFPPSVREMMAHFSIRSTNGVVFHLRALERKGFVERIDYKSRAMSLTDKGWGESRPKGGAIVLFPVKCPGCGREHFRGTEANHVCQADDLRRTA